MKNNNKVYNLLTIEKLVQQGLTQNLITISNNLFDYGVMGIGCKIGDNAFYFCDSEIETMSIKAFMAFFDPEEISYMIAKAIVDMIEDEFLSDEGWYYIAYLEKYLNKREVKQ